VGTDVREFILDGGGANGQNKVLAVDLQQGFVDLGQELFKGPTPGIDFRITNLLDPNDTALQDLIGKVNMLYTGSVFHLFSEANQRRFAERIATLLTREGPAVAFGRHRGAKVAGMFGHSLGLKRFAHDPRSWEQMWREVLGAEAENWTFKTALKERWTTVEGIDHTALLLEWSMWRKA
jgi:hypothetical protein